MSSTAERAPLCQTVQDEIYDEIFLAAPPVKAAFAWSEHPILPTAQSLAVSFDTRRQCAGLSCMCNFVDCHFFPITLMMMHLALAAAASSRHRTAHRRACVSLRKSGAMSEDESLDNSPSFQDRLAAWARDVQEQAAALPPGPERDALLQRVRQAETASQIEQWCASKSAPTDHD